MDGPIDQVVIQTGNNADTWYVVRPGPGSDGRQKINTKRNAIFCAEVQLSLPGHAIGAIRSCFTGNIYLIYDKGSG